MNDLEEIFSQTAIKAQEDLKGYGELILSDLGKSYWNILMILAFSTLLSFTWIILLKYNAKFIVTLSIFSLPVTVSIGLYYSFKNYLSLHSQDPSETLPSDQSLAFDKALQTILTEELLYYVRNESLWLVVSILLLLILVAAIIILNVLKERVTLSIALIKQASKAINCVKSTLFFPILPRLLGIAAITFGVLIGLLIISASHPQYHIDSGPHKGEPCNPRTMNAFNKSSTHQFGASIPQNRPRCVQFQPLGSKYVWRYHALNIFATLWLIHFISGVSRATLSGAFASYYWAYSKPRDVPFFAVTASFFRAVRYHLGDIAFGSFLIATIRYIRIIIEFIDNRLRRKTTATTASDVANTAARSSACCFRVFFWLLDRFLKYIDRNAYIMMSMYGEGYLQSAKRAVELLYNNSTRALVLDYVTYFVLLVSRITITGIAGYITAQEMFTADLHYKWLPIALVVLGTYFISKGLFSVYSMAVDTLFICFLIDSTNNDGSAGRPFFMSKELRRIMKHNTVVSR